MPPQGLLVIAASVPPGWQVRFIDENLDAARRRRLRLGRGRVRQRHARAAAADRATSGAAPMRSTGPSCWAARRYRPVPNTIRISTTCMSARLGDATDELFARLERDATRPAAPGRADHPRAARARPSFRCRPMSWRNSAAISSAASSSPAAVRTSASSATSPRSTAATRASRPPTRSAPSSTRCWPAGCPARSISSTTISSRTGAPCASCCRT